MRIPDLPQVEFDEFPTHQSTKMCIFTQLRHPVPDLSPLVKEGRKLLLFCTESTVLTIGRFAKKLPLELFQILPSGANWMRIDSGVVEGLETPFAVACLPTGSVSDSVMLLILLFNEKPKRLLLYTGMFRECREVELSDLFLKYKNMITDIYVDNTLAGSMHFDNVQTHFAAEKIKAAVDKYLGYKIHLQMEEFDSLDLLVELAHRHRFNVQLSLLQQIFFYKTKYKHLFAYNVQIPNAVELNQEFQLSNRPKIIITPTDTADIITYRRQFQDAKIFTIRLFDGEKSPPDSLYKDGLIYIPFAVHASARRLSHLFQKIQPKRVHPIVDCELNNDSISTIPPDILNDNCEIVNDCQLKAPPLEVSLSDISSPPNQSSFLDATTLILGTTKSELPAAEYSGLLHNEIIRAAEMRKSPSTKRPPQDDIRQLKSKNVMPSARNTTGMEEPIELDSDSSEPNFVLVFPSRL